MHSNVYKGSKSRDIGHNARKYHPLFHVFYAGYILVKFEYLKPCSGVKAWLVQFFHNVLQGGQTTVFRHISVYVNFLAQTFVCHQFLHGGAGVGSHLFY